MAQEGSPAVRVAVRSGYALVRAGLGELVRSAGPTLALVSEDDAPDVVVVDLAGWGTARAQEEVRALAARRPVLGLTRDGHPDQERDARLLGVRRTVAEGVSAAGLVEAVVALAAEGPPAAALSERERLTVRLVAAGLSNQQIAAEMFVSVNSVKTYVRTAYRKMGVRSRPEAVLWAVRHGLSDEGPR